MSKLCDHQPFAHKYEGDLFFIFWGLIMVRVWVWAGVFMHLGTAIKSD